VVRIGSSGHSALVLQAGITWNNPIYDRASNDTAELHLRKGDFVLRE